MSPFVQLGLEVGIVILASIYLVFQYNVKKMLEYWVYRRQDEYDRIIRWEERSIRWDATRDRVLVDRDAQQRSYMKVNWKRDGF